MKTTYFLFAGFALALTMLGGAAWIEWRHIARMQETMEWVAHTHEIRTARNLLFLLIRDIENGQRSYVLTGEPVFLEMFERAVDQVAQAARALLDALVTNAPPRDRDIEASKARAKGASRFRASDARPAI